MRFIVSIPLLLASTLLLFCGNQQETEPPARNQTTALTAPQQPVKLQQSIQSGAAIYKSVCVQCHLPNGEGVPGSFPPLAGSNWLTEKRTESIRAVKYGLQGEIVVNGVTYNGVMTSAGLSDAKVADVMNYIMNSWGNTQKTAVTTQEVSKVASKAP